MAHHYEEDTDRPVRCLENRVSDCRLKSERPTTVLSKTPSLLNLVASADERVQQIIEEGLANLAIIDELEKYLTPVLLANEPSEKDTGERQEARPKAATDVHEVFDMLECRMAKLRAVLHQGGHRLRSLIERQIVQPVS